MNEQQLRESLARIAEIATMASKAGTAGSKHPGTGISGSVPANMPGCSIKALPKRLLIKAAQTAIRINPVNSPMKAPVGVGSALGIMEPMRIAVLTSKYWGPTPRQLNVSFLEDTPPDLRARILSHMNAWTATACISFAETSGAGDVRITFVQSGYWSYLGTDILHIPANQPTMCLQDFSMDTPESEYHRVVRHETGHTLGFPHEHMRQAIIDRIDPQKAYQYFLQTQGWDKAMVDAQVLTPLNESDLNATATDVTSIMCYQLPGSITTDGQPIPGGLDIDDLDYQFAGTIYPKTGSALAVVGSGGRAVAAAPDWPASQDVDPFVRK
jgi:hypothetical protein